MQAFIQVMPDLVKRATKRTAKLQSRIINDAIAKAEFEEKVRSLPYEMQYFMYVTSK